MPAQFGAESFESKFPRAVELWYVEPERLPLLKGQRCWAGFDAVIVIWRAVWL